MLTTLPERIGKIDKIFPYEHIEYIRAGRAGPPPYVQEPAQPFGCVDDKLDVQLAAGLYVELMRFQVPKRLPHRTGILTTGTGNPKMMLHVRPEPTLHFPTSEGVRCVAQHQVQHCGARAADPSHSDDRQVAS